MLVNTKGPNAEREKRWIKNFRHTANFVSNSELIALCDVSKEGCKKFVNLFGTRQKDYKTPSLFYAYPVNDRMNHFNIFTPYRGDLENPDAVIKYAADCKEGKGITNTLFTSEMPVRRVVLDSGNASQKKDQRKSNVVVFYSIILITRNLSILTCWLS
jgi:hypothetical protein